MPYPLPEQPATVGGARVRLLPPLGCPGLEQWVLPMEFGRWAELGYRKGPIPASDLELFWLCLLYTSPSPRDLSTSRMPSSA